MLCGDVLDNIDDNSLHSEIKEKMKELASNL